MVGIMDNYQSKFICPVCELAGHRAEGVCGLENGKTVSVHKAWQGRVLSYEQYLQIPTFLRRGKKIATR